MDTSTAPVISTTENPDAAAAAAADAFRKAQVGDRPQPELPPDGEVRLPAGLWDLLSGENHQTAVVRELTGADEEELARPANLKNASRFVTTMLARTVESIGGTKPEVDQLRDLLVGDREALVLGVRKATYGHELKLDTQCPACRHEFRVTYDLNEDVPIRELKDGQRVLEVELRRGGVAKVAIPTGRDQEAVLDADTKSRAEANSVMLSRVVREINGVEVRTLAQVQALGVADRRAIVEAIYEAQPGPRYEEVRQECPRCETSYPLIIGLGDLFHL